MSCCILCSSVFASAKFIDVKKGAWYEDSVAYVVGKGIMVGVSDNTFAPSASVTRAMFAQILYRLSGSNDFYVSSPYEDVSIRVWYGKAVAWANANGIMSGYGKGRFGPNDSITREQLALTLYRFSGGAGGYEGPGVDGFIDGGDVSPWARNAMSWAIGNGMVSGSGGRLNPRKCATRAEASSILARYCEKFVYEDDEPGDIVEPEPAEPDGHLIKAEDGRVRVEYNGDTDRKLRVKSTFGDKETVYVIEPNREYTYTFPYGPGEYEVTLYENTSGIKYRRVMSDTFNVSDEQAESALTCPATYYDYPSTQGVLSVVDSLWDTSRTDEDNAKAVYDWVISNIKYDTDRAASVSTGYLPDLDHVMEQGKGTCLDYAALYATMLRSQGVPCQVVIGYYGSDRQCHAWVRSRFDGEWAYSDPTFGAGRRSMSDRYFHMEGNILAQYETDYMV